MCDGKNGLVRFDHRRLIRVPPGTDPGWRIEPNGHGGYRRVGRPRCYAHVANGLYREITPEEFERRQRARNAGPRPKIISLRRPSHQAPRRRQSASRGSLYSRGKGAERDDGSGDGDGDPPPPLQRPPRAPAGIGGQR